MIYGYEDVYKRQVGKVLFYNNGFCRNTKVESGNPDIVARVVAVSYTHLDVYKRQMRENTTKIRNIKQYLKAALFNAPSTIGNYYTSLVAHDMASGALAPKKPQYGDPDYYSFKPGESL